ncbi:MAG: hypothetical protein E7574_02215 [Ruminococcaceae bacterium]|nr:hypothetical protein [Oscillospiraceae bacterium]
MKLKNKDILKFAASVKYLYEKDNIPFLTSLTISDNVQLLDENLIRYFSSKEEIDKKHLEFNSADKDISDSVTPSIKHGHEELYLKEITELNDKDVDINITKVNPEELFAISFTPKHIEGISFMLDR